jgi:hypothetical protein
MGLSRPLQLLPEDAAKGFHVQRTSGPSQMLAEGIVHHGLVPSASGICTTAELLQNLIIYVGSRVMYCFCKKCILPGVSTLDELRRLDHQETAGGRLKLVGEPEKL